MLCLIPLIFLYASSTVYKQGVPKLYRFDTAKLKTRNTYKYICNECLLNSLKDDLPVTKQWQKCLAPSVLRYIECSAAKPDETLKTEKRGAVSLSVGGWRKLLYLVLASSRRCFSDSTDLFLCMHQNCYLSTTIMKPETNKENKRDIYIIDSSSSDDDSVVVASPVKGKEGLRKWTSMMFGRKRPRDVQKDVDERVTKKRDLLMKVSGGLVKSREPDRKETSVPVVVAPRARKRASTTLMAPKSDASSSQSMVPKIVEAPLAEAAEEEEAPTPNMISRKESNDNDVRANSPSTFHESTESELHEISFSTLTVGSVKLG